MVIHDLAAALLLGIAAAAPLVLMRARYGHWRAGRVADLVDGERIKVGGTVEPLGRPLRAPFIEIDCVAYSLWHEDPAPPDRSDYHQRGQDFILRDDAGQSVLVRVDEQFDLHEGRRILHTPSNVDAQLIQAGDPVYVIGVAAEVPDVEGLGATYREPPRRWTLGGSPERPLVIVGRRRAPRRS